MENQNQAIMAALGYPMLPQTVKPVTNTKTTVQRVEYNPEQMQAMVDALRTPQQMQQNKWELLGGALAKNLASPTYEGAYGVKFTNGKTDALARGANMFNDIYGTQKQQERDAANAKRENEIKIAQMLMDAGKQSINEETENTHIKVNDPNSKQFAAMQEQAKNARVLDTMSRDLENIGTRFDEDFKNIDDMQQNSTRWGRAHTNGWWGVGTTDSEKLARDEFKAWKGSMKNVLVNANRQAGSGSMSDADAARYEQAIGDAKTPAEARNILRSFQKRMAAENPGIASTNNGMAF